MNTRLLLHGDNTVLSRQELLKLKQQLVKTSPQIEISPLNGLKLTLTDLIEVTESGSLFASDRLVIIENVHRHPSKKTLPTLLEYLSQLGPGPDYILWESKTLTPSQLKRLSNFTVRLFRSSSTTFKFLEHLSPKNSANVFPLFERACDQDTPEFVFYMLCRQVRLLLRSAGSNTALPAWQQNKLRAQAKQFSTGQLLSLHDRLTDLDWRLKSGQTVGTISGELQQIICTLDQGVQYATS